jgi:hypothetical protein
MAGGPTPGSAVTAAEVKKKLSKQFVDRDLNAAANILLAGISKIWPLHLTRHKASSARKRASPLDSSCGVMAKKTHLVNKYLAISPARPSNDPFLAFSQESDLLRLASEEIKG